MPRTRTALLAAVVALLAACGDTATTPQQPLDHALNRAFNPAFAGTAATVSSFSTSRDSAGGSGGSHGHGPTGLCDDFDFMGGGFRDDYLGRTTGGSLPFNPSGRSGSCTYSAATGETSCDSTVNGLRYTSTLAYRTAAGAAQQAFDSTTTHSAATRVTVKGTITVRDTINGTAGRTTAVDVSSERTVTGLSKTSTQRTVNGTSAGTETTTGTSDRGPYTATRVQGDTTRALLIPVQRGAPSYPVGGTVIREMRVTLTYQGKQPATSTRREVVTYDGSSTARLEVTQDGKTKACTVALPYGRPVCD